MFDPAFGSSDGIEVDSDQWEEFYRIAIDQQDRVVCAGLTHPNGGSGSAFIARVLDNGSLDSSFHDDGMRVWNLGAVETHVLGLAVDDDGSIYISGSSAYPYEHHMSVVHFLENGQLDPSFGVNGVRHIVTDSPSMAGDITILDDGSLMAVGYTYSDTVTETDLALVHLFPNGTLDMAFGVEGIKIVPEPGLQMGHEIMKNGSDHILVGLAPPGKVAKFDLAGVLDTTFNAPYGMTEVVDWYGNRISLATDEQGSIYVLSSSSYYPYVSPAHLRKFHPNGMLDSTFAVSGQLELSDGLFGMISQKILIRPDGRIIISAMTTDWWLTTSTYIMQFLPSGAIDPDFGSLGKFYYEVRHHGAFRDPRYMAIDDLNRIYLPGCGLNSPDDPVLYRYSRR